jgi:hypothetical protein
LIGMMAVWSVEQHANRMRRFYVIIGAVVGAVVGFGVGSLVLPELPELQLIGSVAGTLIGALAGELDHRHGRV